MDRGINECILYYIKLIHQQTYVSTIFFLPIFTNHRNLTHAQTRKRLHHKKKRIIRFDLKKYTIYLTPVG